MTNDELEQDVYACRRRRGRGRGRPTVVEPAVLEAVQGVEQRHVEQADHPSDGVDGEEADHHTLEHGNTPSHAVHNRAPPTPAPNTLSLRRPITPPGVSVISHSERCLKPLGMAPRDITRGACPPTQMYGGEISRPVATYSPLSRLAG